MNNVKCKYGRNYFEKLSAEDTGKKRIVEKGGLAWRLLKTVKIAKKALKKRDISEEQLMARFTEEDKAQLSTLLDKLEAAQGN